MVVIVAVVITAVIVVFTYRQGLKDGKQINDGECLKPIIKKKVNVSKEQQNAMTMINNLNRYDGTGKGQIKI